MMRDLSIERSDGTAESAAANARFNAERLDERNKRMAKKIESLFDEEGDSFVVVGAAHLVGVGSIPELLGAAGHAVSIVAP